MHIKTRNVNTAFKGIVTGVRSGEIPTVVTQSRAGEVLQVPEPVLITYERPCERVLFNTARDANPFFHLYEALWMLAGRRDVAPLSYYNSQIAEIASDDGKTFNGAYGYRWRHHFDTTDNYPEGPYIDQLDLLVQHLKQNPTSRRAVLQMWTVEDDLLKVGCSRGTDCSTHTSKDVCCNLSVMFNLRNNVPEDGLNLYLDMTVTNRSNDAIWGLLGANFVHFTILQEYMAARLGVEVGLYHHFTNNLHFYTAEGRWNPNDWLDVDIASGGYAPGKDWRPFPLVSRPEEFDLETKTFVERHSKDSIGGEYNEKFLQYVAQPMCVAFHHHKRRDYKNAMMAVANVAADDWRTVTTKWLSRRQKAHEGRIKATGK